MSLIIFLTSLVLTGLMIFLARKLRIGIDGNLSGVQKFHTIPTPRLGGVGVYVAVGLGAFLIDNDMILLLWLSGSAAFLGGVLEDITAKITPFWRLMLTFVSAVTAFVLVEAQLRRVGVVGFNELFAASTIAAALFTAFAVGGVAHSINIVDGYNGLMLGTCLIAFAAFGLLAYQLGDTWLLQLCLLGGAAALGLFVLNFPFGLIFCGDGGAYFLGFWLAEIAVLTVFRHEAVSPWFGFMVMAYPIVETLFSMYRKKVLRGMSPGLPDGAHLHMLVYKRIIRYRARNTTISLVLQNAATAPIMWLFSIGCAIWAINAWDSTINLLLGLLIFTVLYVLLYRRLVKFGIRSGQRSES